MKKVEAKSYGVIPIFKGKDGFYILLVKNSKGGHWGLPKGTPEKDEKPIDTAKRELFEETGFKPKTIHKLGSSILPELDNPVIHYYYCEFTTTIDKVKLNEGEDFALVPFKEILSGKIYSEKKKKFLPLAAPSFTKDIVMEKFLSKIGGGA